MLYVAFFKIKPGLTAGSLEIVLLLAAAGFRDARAEVRETARPGSRHSCSRESRRPGREIEI
jgi:hypothetical protein